MQHDHHSHDHHAVLHLPVLPGRPRHQLVERSAMSYHNQVLCVCATFVLAALLLTYTALGIFDKAAEIKASAGDMQLVCKVVKP